MTSTPVVHHLLFFLSVLFGINVPMIGQQSVVKVDLAENKGSIAYQNLITSDEFDAKAESALNQIYEAENFNTRYNFMQLTDKSFIKDRDNLQLKISFNYEEENEKILLGHLGFKINEQGNVIYEILEKETFISSNGKKQEELIEWPAKDSIMYVEVKGEVLDENEKASSVSLAKYWNAE